MSIQFYISASELNANMVSYLGVAGKLSEKL